MPEGPERTERTNGASRGPEREGVPGVIEFYPDHSQVRVLDVVLDILPAPEDPMARRFIPVWEKLQKETCWDTPTVTLVRDMAIRLASGISSRNEGPTGVSKSFAIEVICALTNRSYLRHNYSRDSDIGDTIGRFVPSDHSLTVRFEELLASPNLGKDEREIVETAKRESRSLTVYESKLVAKSLGIDSLSDDKNWVWKNGTLTGSMAYGTVFGADEVNLAPGNIVERENSALETHPTMRLVEHEGEIIRPLNAAEQSIVDKGGVVPGVIGLDRRFWYVAAQNPYGIGGGRYQESEARRNRLQDRVVDALTEKEYTEFMMFLIHGDQPDIVWQGRRFRGEKNIQTQYRGYESTPNVDMVITRIAKMQCGLDELAQKGKIGAERDIKGGSYVYTRRNLIRFLDIMKGSGKALLDMPETLKRGQPVYNTNPHDLAMEGIYQEYISGVYDADKSVIKDLVDAMGIEELLGESVNNPKPPVWVEAAGKRGVQVTRDGGTWRIK